MLTKKKPKILITGGAGFIGRHLSLCDEFVKRKWDVRVYDIAINPMDDVMNVQRLMSVLLDEEIGGIIHLAACSRVKWGHEYPDWCTKVNVCGTLNVLQAAAEIGVMRRPSPFVLVASSREVYGNEYAEEDRANEYSPLRPMNVYASTKVMEENLSYSFYKNYGVLGGVVRFGGVYTSKFDHKDRVIPKFIGQAFRGEKITVNGNVKLPFIYIDDTVNALRKVIKRYLGGSDAHDNYLIATNQTVELYELAELICQKTKSKSKIEVGDYRHYDVDQFYADPHLTYNKLKWEPEYDISSGLNASIRSL
ncbi:MAG: NAD(P)-dependent oxidoreductase [Perlabentimonas sp.]